MAFPYKHIFISIVFLAGSAILAFPVLPLPNRAPIETSAPYAALLAAFTAGKEQPEKQEIFPPEPPALTAEAVIVYSMGDQKVLYQKNADTPYGIASITKLMTALTALERVGENERIRISLDAIRTEGAEGNLVVGEHIPLKDLIMLMITESSNDAAAAMAEHIGMLYGAETFEESQNIFTEFMNKKARDNGLSSATYFLNPTGLDSDEDGKIISNYSTAYDIIQLVASIAEYPVLWNANTESGSVVSEEGYIHEIFTTHEMLATEPGILTGKTGYTEAAGGALVTIVEAPLRTIQGIVVLGSTREDRFTDTRKLIEWLRL
jgi:D-alanyl-D-alanine carboxypeptidase